MLCFCTLALASKPHCPCYLHVLERERRGNTGIEIDTHFKPSALNAEEPEEVVAYELVDGQRCNSSLPAAFKSHLFESWLADLMQKIRMHGRATKQERGLRLDVDALTHANVGMSTVQRERSGSGAQTKRYRCRHGHRVYRSRAMRR